MNVTCDPAKDKANLAKHGFSLLDAADFEWEAALVWPDERRDYNEARMVGLRKANNREVKRYANND